MQAIICNKAYPDFIYLANSIASGIYAQRLLQKKYKKEISFGCR